MLEFIYNQILFYISLAIVLFLPGYFLLLAIFGKSGKLSSLEKFVLSFGLSIIITDILLIFLNKFGIIINRISLLASLGLFFLICYLIYYLRRKKYEVEETESRHSGYSRFQILAIVLIILTSIFFRTAHLAKNITPSATDLGHHMFWVEKIIQTGKISDFQKVDIIQNDGHYSISEPVKIDDFIIGEHLIFAAVGLISGASVISTFPVIVLFLINIIGLLAVFILAKVFFNYLPYGKTIPILSILFLGVLYALSAPQANYISGGVIGNLIGNLFAPMAFYLLFRAIKENNPPFFALGLLTIFGLAYTHHLSAFIFGFALAFSLLFLAAIKRKEIIGELKENILAYFFGSSRFNSAFLRTVFLFYPHAGLYRKPGRQKRNWRSVKDNQRRTGFQPVAIRGRREPPNSGNCRHCFAVSRR